MYVYKMEIQELMIVLSNILFLGIVKARYSLQDTVVTLVSLDTLTSHSFLTLNLFLNVWLSFSS